MESCVSSSVGVKTSNVSTRTLMGRLQHHSRTHLRGNRFSSSVTLRTREFGLSTVGSDTRFFAHCLGKVHPMAIISVGS